MISKGEMSCNFEYSRKSSKQTPHGKQTFFELDHPGLSNLPTVKMSNFKG